MGKVKNRKKYNLRTFSPLSKVIQKLKVPIISARDMDNANLHLDAISPCDFNWDVSGSMYKVEVKPEVGDELLTEGNDGYCTSDTHSIVLKEGLDLQRQWKVFLHEIIHAFENQYNFDLPHSKVDQLETALYHFVKININKLKNIV